MANRGARQGRAQDRGNVFRANLLSSEQSPLVLGVPAKQLCGRGSAAKVSAGSRCGLRPHAAGSIYAKGTTAWMGLPRKVRQVEGIAFEGVKELPEPGSLLDLDRFLIWIASRSGWLPDLANLCGGSTARERLEVCPIRKRNGANLPSWFAVEREGQAVIERTRTLFTMGRRT
jgi:hypothetical protein